MKAEITEALEKDLPEVDSEIDLQDLCENFSNSG